MEIDVRRLLALPAGDRLALAEMLNQSVGYPANIDTLPLPAWQCARIDHLLRTYAGDVQECEANDLRV